MPDFAIQLRNLETKLCIGFSLLKERDCADQHHHAHEPQRQFVWAHHATLHSTLAVSTIVPEQE